jgi:hypothetical protein
MSRRRKWQRAQTSAAPVEPPKKQIPGQFAWRTIAMLQSPAFRVLSLPALRFIDRLEIELARHAGKKNGKLIVTYKDFQEYGVRRNSVAQAQAEVVRLGFVEVTTRGRAAYGEFRCPNKYRLTYRPIREDGTGPTDEWRQIATIEDAKRRKVGGRKKQKTAPQNGGRTAPQIDTEKGKKPPPKSILNTGKATPQTRDPLLEPPLGRQGSSNADGHTTAADDCCPSTETTWPADSAEPKKKVLH